MASMVGRAMTGTFSGDKWPGFGLGLVQLSQLGQLGTFGIPYCSRPQNIWSNFPAQPWSIPKKYID